MLGVLWVSMMNQICPVCKQILNDSYYFSSDIYFNLPQYAAKMVVGGGYYMCYNCQPDASVKVGRARLFQITERFMGLLVETTGFR